METIGIIACSILGVMATFAVIQALHNMVEENRNLKEDVERLRKERKDKQEKIEELEKELKKKQK